MYLILEVIRGNDGFVFKIKPPTNREAVRMTNTDLLRLAQNKAVFFIRTALGDYRIDYHQLDQAFAFVRLAAQLKETPLTNYGILLDRDYRAEYTYGGAAFAYEGIGKNEGKAVLVVLSNYDYIFSVCGNVYKTLAGRSVRGTSKGLLLYPRGKELTQTVASLTSPKGNFDLSRTYVSFVRELNKRANQ